MRLAGTGCPGEAADDIGGTCLGQAEPSAELRQRRVLLVSELDYSARPDLVGQLSSDMPNAMQTTDVASEIVKQLPSVVDGKGDRDMVSDVDVRIERAVRAYLGEETPEVGFLGEETGDTPGSNGLQWVLDPVDGTANFVKGIPLYAI